MLLKISLVLAILIGLATLYLTHVKVADKISTLTQERDAASTAKSTAEQEKGKALGEAKTAKQQMEAAKKDLAEKTVALEAESAKRAEQESRANKTSEELEKKTEERNEAQRALAAWNALGTSIEAVRGMRDELKKTQVERDAYADEVKTFSRANRQLRITLDRYEGANEDEKDVKLPAGLKGKVVAVDPKYDSVVLDIGGNQGVLENGKLLVNRNGKLIARLRITTVEPNRSIANIMPDWKQDDVLEGDQVLY